MPITIGQPVTLDKARQKATGIRDRAVDEAVGLVRQSETLPDLYRDAVEDALTPIQSGASQAGSRISLGDPVTFTTGQRQVSGVERYVTAPFGRGIDRFQAITLLALGDTEGFSEQQRQIANSVQLTPEDQEVMRQIDEEDTLWGATKLWLSNPGPLTAMVSESFGTMTPGFGASLAAGLAGGPVAAAAAMGAYSGGLIEMVGEIEQQAVERGVDPTDAKAMDALLEQPGFLKEALSKGAARGLPIGVLDAVSMGIAGKTYNLVRQGKKTAGVARRLTASLAELNTQGTLGATGEALAGAATGEYRPGEIVAEYLGEAVTGGAEVLTNVLSRRDRAAPGAPPPTPEATVTTPVPPDVVEALRATERDPAAEAERRRRFEETTGRQQPLPLEGGEGLVVPETEAPASDIQGRFQRGIRQQKLPLETEPAPELTDEEVQTRMAEAATVEEGAVPAEPDISADVVPFEPTPPAEPQTTVARLNQWMEAQEREETTTKAGRKISRQKKLFTEETSKTKVTPTSLVKAGLLSIGEAVRKQKIAKANDLAPFTTRDSSAQKIGDYYDSLLAAVENANRKDIADALRTVFNTPDPWETFARLQAVEGVIKGGLDVAPENIGTIYEPVIAQYRRARVEADKIYQQGVKPPRVKDRIQAVQSMYSAVVRLFEQRAGTKITRGSDEAIVARTMSAKEIAKRLEKQAPYLQEAGADLAGLYGQLFGAKDATTLVTKRVYEKLDTIGENLAKRGGKQQKARDAAVQEAGKKRAAEQQVVEVTPTTPAPVARKRSEKLPETEQQKLAEDRELAREARLQGLAASQEIKANENQVASAERAGKEQPKEVTEAHPKKPKSRKKRSQAAQPHQTGHQQVAVTTTPEGRAAEEERIRKLPPKREKVKTQLFAPTEKVEDTRVTIRPHPWRSRSAVLRKLKLSNRTGGMAILSDLPFFRAIIDRTVDFKTRRQGDPAYIAGLRDQLPAEKRRQFDELIELYVNTEAQPFATPNEITTGTPPAPAQVVENEIKTFLKENVTNADKLSLAAINYARALRTLQRHGFEQGSIVLEGPLAVSVYNEVLATHSADFLSAVQRPLRESILAENPLQLGTMNQLTEQWLSSIPEQATWLRDILSKLNATGVDVPVILDPNLSNDDGPIGGRYAHTSQGRFIAVNPNGTDGQTLRTLLHEMVHASTSYGYDTSDRYRKAVDRLYAEAVKAAGAAGLDFYGLKNGKEFLAEGFTNVEFQNFLKSIGPSNLSVWQRFVNAVREFFGMDAKHFNVFDTLISQSDQLFLSESDIVSPTGVTDELGGGGDGGGISASTVKRDASKWLGAAADLAQKGNLGFMDLNVMERKYRSLIGKAAEIVGVVKHPLTSIAEAITKTSRQARALASAFQEVADEVQKLELQQRTALGAAMELVTRAQLDPTQNISQQNQPHLYDKKGKLKNADLLGRAKAAYDALPADTKSVLNQLRDLTSVARGIRRAALLKYALQSSFPEITETDLSHLSSAPTVEEFASYVATHSPSVEGVPLDPDKLNTLADSVFAAGEIPGTYFPLRRNGEYVTSIDADEIEEAYFAMHATRAEAEADAARLLAAGKGEANVSKVIRGENDAATSRAVQAIIAKLDPSEAVSEKVQAALHKAMAEVLADRVLFASQLKRQGVEGAKPSDMLKNVEDYIRSSISTTSQLDTAHDYRTGLHALATIQKAENLEADVKDTAGNIRNELLIRAQESASDRNIMMTDRILGSVGFFTYLGAPSYWILNSTQTAVVGVPVLAGLANKGYIQSARAMTRAYGILQKATKGQGTAALTGNLEETKAKLTSEQQQVITRLEEDNVIQATIAHEFNVLTKAGSGVYSKVTNVLTGVPEAVERFNRISMALAAMDLGVTDYTQIKDIVEASQFNYDPSNRARLLKYAPEFLGGGARRFIAPMMMFKVFGVNMARLVYGNLFDAMFKKGMSPAERAASLKIVAGLVGSHTLVGGMFGGLGLGMNQMIMAVINGLLDDEDEIDPAAAIDEFLTEHTNEYVARLLTRGLPAAVGVDMSASVNLGNLLFMPRDTDWAEYGGVEQSVYGLLGPVAQYFAGSARETSRFIDGEADFADVLEKSVPLKLYRALSQTWRYGMEGLETRQGQQFMEPLDVGDLLATSLGLRSARVAQRQEQFYAARTLNRTLESKKSELMAEAATAVNAAQRRRARKTIREWNAKQRERRNYSLIIRQDSIRRSRSQRQEVGRQYGRGEFTPYR